MRGKIAPLELVKRVRRGDHAAASRALTAVVNDAPGSEALAKEFFRASGSAQKVGVSGPPGAGKSSLTGRLISFYRRKKLKVIEDCAHAIETEYHGQKAGTFGDLGCFSFYVTKNIVTGEGGMVITNKKVYADKIKVLGLHGMSKDAWKRFSDEGYKHYEIVYAGFKYNMMDLQAAIGLHQMERIDQYWKRRQKIWNQYNKAFADLPVFLPQDAEEGTRHAYHLYTLLLNVERLKITRDQFMQKMMT